MNKIWNIDKKAKTKKPNIWYVFYEFPVSSCALIIHALKRFYTIFTSLSLVVNHTQKTVSYFVVKRSKQ